MKLVPPLTPMAKLYGSKYFVKAILLCRTMVDVKARRHPLPTATGLNLVRSSGSLCRPKTKLDV